MFVGSTKNQKSESHPSAVHGMRSNLTPTKHVHTNHATMPALTFPRAQHGGPTARRAYARTALLVQRGCMKCVCVRKIKCGAISDGSTIQGTASIAKLLARRSYMLRVFVRAFVHSYSYSLARSLIARCPVGSLTSNLQYFFMSMKFEQQLDNNRSGFVWLATYDIAVRRTPYNTTVNTRIILTTCRYP